MAPINTKSGMASSVGSLIATNQRAGNTFSVFGLNTPARSPRKAKPSAVLANEKATL